MTGEVGFTLAAIQELGFTPAVGATEEVNLFLPTY
jgi:hypothetical protein